MKLRRLASFVAASAVIIGLLGQSATIVLAADHTQYWQGNGVKDGAIGKIECDQNNTPGQLWIWTGDGSNVWISVDGELKQGVEQGQGSWHFQTGWHDIGDLTPGDNGNVFVTYDGALDGNAVLTLSHGCPATTTTTTTTTTTVPSTTTTESSSSSTTTTESSSSRTTTTASSSSSTTTTESSSSSTTTTESSSSTTTTTTTTTTVPVTTTTTTSFSQSQQAATDVPTEPNTAAIETGGPSNPSSSVWMLIVALGLLLGSVVILTPAPSKTKR